MINAIGADARAPMNVSYASNGGLSTEQKDFIEQTLSQFDADALSEEDARSIIETFKEAGIQPGKQLESAMAASGFDAKQVGDLGGAGERPPSGQQSSESVQFSEVVDYLTELLDTALSESESGTLSEDQKLSIYETMSEKFNIQADSSIINTVA